MLSAISHLLDNHKNQFDEYRHILIKWNKKINLTSITDQKKIELFHFLDSLSIVEQIVPRGTILDIGSGSGFPGIPIKITNPDVHVTLVESVGKKCSFMKEVIRKLDLKSVDVVQHTLKYGESLGQFDFVVSRATLKMNELIQLAAPNLRVGGSLIAMKGEDVSKEVENCQDLLDELGFEPISEISYEISTSKRKLLITKLTKLFHVEQFC